MKRRIVFQGVAALGAALVLSTAASAQKTEFWMGNGVAAVNSFMAHRDKIDIISPTWYQIDETGLVTGEPNTVVLKAAKQSHMTVIPLFAIFDHVKIHQLVNDQKAQDEMNRAFSGVPSSGYVPPVHLFTAANIGSDGGPHDVFDPDNGYREQYKKIWGK